MFQTENCFTYLEVKQTLKVAIYLSLVQLRENFRQNCTKLTMFVFVKSTKGCFQRGSFNDIHVNLSLLKDFYHF